MCVVGEEGVGCREVRRGERQSPGLREGSRTREGNVFRASRRIRTHTYALDWLTHTPRTPHTHPTHTHPTHSHMLVWLALLPCLVCRGRRRRRVTETSEGRRGKRGVELLGFFFFQLLFGHASEVSHAPTTSLGLANSIVCVRVSLSLCVCGCGCG